MKFTHFKSRTKLLFFIGLLAIFSLWGVLAYLELVSFQMAAILVLPSFLGLALVSFVVYSLGSWQRLQQHIIKEGVSAPAMILEAKNNYAIEDSSLWIELKLNVFLEGETPIQTNLILTKDQSQTRSYQVGDIIPVKVGRVTSRTTNQVLQYLVVLEPLLENERARAFWATQQEFETWLLRHNTESELIRNTGELAQAKILTFQGMGMFVGQNHPVVELEVEVMPESTPPFKVSLRAIIQAASVIKFQPGNTIWVKFDKEQHTRVALVGSTPTGNTLVLPMELQARNQPENSFQKRNEPRKEPHPK